MSTPGVTVTICAPTEISNVFDIFKGHIKGTLDWNELYRKLKVKLGIQEDRIFHHSYVTFH